MALLGRRKRFVFLVARVTQTYIFGKRENHLDIGLISNSKI